MRFLLLLLLSSPMAIASSFEDPYIEPKTPFFFKNHYYYSFESPLIDHNNDPASNLFLILRKKNSFRDVPKKGYAEVEITQEKPKILRSIESFLTETDKKNETTWGPQLQEIQQVFYRLDSWYYSQPSICGRHEQGIEAFHEFLKTQDLGKEDVLFYTKARLELSVLCEKITNTYSSQESFTLEPEHEKSVNTFISSVQNRIRKSLLRERISDYLTILIESYARQGFSVPTERQTALLKTNVNFIRDSFTYYAVRLLAADQGENEVTGLATVQYANLPSAVTESFGEMTPLQLWQKYVKDFPQGRFVKSAKGLLRRHNGDHYFEEFQKYLEDAVQNPSYQECGRYTYELKTILNEETDFSKIEPFQKLASSPVLFTVFIFKRISTLGFFDTPDTGAPLHRRSSMSEMSNWKEIIALIDKSKAFDAYDDLRNLIKVALYYRNSALKELHQLKLSPVDGRTSVYVSALRYKAWALEEQEKFAEAMSIWDEIAASVEMNPSDFISPFVPKLENYYLSKNQTFNWSDYKTVPKVLVSYVTRHLDKELTLSKIASGKEDPNIVKELTKELLRTSLIQQDWKTAAALKPHTEAQLPQGVWKAITKLGTDANDTGALLEVAKFLLKNDQGYEIAKENFGTIVSPYKDKDFPSAGTIFMKLADHYKNAPKSEAEAEVLSHLSKCDGRQYTRDYFCYLGYVDEKVKKGWFRKLHQKYKGSDWAKATPHYF